MSPRLAGLGRGSGAGEVSEIEIMPVGPFPIHSKDQFTLHDADGFIANTMRIAGNYHGEILVDFDHMSSTKHGSGRDTIAAGWIRALRHDAARKRIMATVAWTSLGAEAIRQRLYRYVSPEFQVRAGQIVSLSRAGLTNDPAAIMAPIELPARKR